MGDIIIFYLLVGVAGIFLEIIATAMGLQGRYENEKNVKVK